MAIQNEPTRIQIPFADSGTKNVIPDTNSTPSASQAASWTDGFPSQCSLPLSAGGIPPARADFNGIFNTITQSERFTQEGGIWAWDATVDYAANRLVLGSDGLLYWSVAQNGPGFASGAIDPTTDDGTYWSSPSVKTMPAQDRSQAAVNSLWVAQWVENFVALPQNLYVDAINGDDANNGFTASTAVKTLSHVINIIQQSRSRCELTNIHVASGEYSDGISSVREYAIHYDFESGAKIKNAYLTGGLVYLSGSVEITESRLSVDKCGSLWLGYPFTPRKTLTVNFSNNLALDAFIYVTDCSSVFSDPSIPCTINFGTGQTATYATVACIRQSYMLLYGVSFAGSVTGSRYQVGSISQINGTGSVTKIPGTIAGRADASQYSLYS